MLYQTRHLRFLVDPYTGEDLTPISGGVASPSNIYPIQDEIYRLSLNWEALTEQSEKYDEACSDRGWTPPNEVGFKGLPQFILEGWGGEYWQSRALSLAGVWEVLERDRRFKKRLPIGFQGMAAQLTNSLPYAAYGFDVGGFQSFALSPHVGEYGLGVYGAGRYARIQTDWRALPLRQNSFDVVIMTGLLNEIPREQGEPLLAQAIRLLAAKGCLFITDVPEIQKWEKAVQALGAQSRLVSVKENTLTSQLKSLWRQNPQVPPMMIVQLS